MCSRWVSGQHGGIFRIGIPSGFEKRERYENFDCEIKELRQNEVALRGRGKKAWVDLGKGISILLVVLFHCEEYLPIVDTGTAGPFSFFRMPFFFFLSGYIFVSDYTQFSLRRKLKQILRGIVWTYLIFALILVVPKSLSNGYPVADGLKMIF